MAEDGQELERIRRSYAQRAEIPLDKYSCFEPAVLLKIQERERRMLEALAGAGRQNLSQARILEVGCGWGDVLHRFIGYGARPEHLHGIDLLAERTALARELGPNMNFVCGNGGALPYRDGVFDIAMQFTAFSSVLDRDMRVRMAKEMRRVLRPSGMVLWYDFWLNPTNREVRGIRPAEVRALFPGCRYRFLRLTVAPPLARRVAKRSVLICQLLERVPFLLSHYLALIEPIAGA